MGMKEYIAEIGIEIFYLPIENIKGKFEDLYKVREHARRLEAELEKAKLQLSYFTDAVEENRRLREFLSLETDYGLKLIPAEIVKLPDIPNQCSVIINVGSDFGVRPDMAAIAPDGLAGKVKRVYDNSSEVQLLIDPSSRVSAVDNRSRVQGILKFNPIDGMILDNVPVHEDIAEGDTIKTSGVGGVFPQGIPLGVVAHFKIGSTSYFFAEIKVEPFVKFSRLERLFIMDNASR